MSSTQGVGCNDYFGYQPDCIWNKLEFRNGGYSYDVDLEARRQHGFDPVPGPE